MIHSLIVIFVWIFPLLIGAESLQAEDHFKRIGQGIRNLGMGNTGIALSHDENALQYNPAGMAGMDTVILSLPVYGEIGNDSIDMVTELQKVDGNNSSLGDFADVGLGKRLHLRLMVATNLMVPFPQQFTVGANMLYELSFDFLIENPVLLEASIGFRYDAINTVGVAFPLHKGEWVLGFGLRSVTRMELPTVKLSLGTLAEIGTQDDDLYKEFGQPDKAALGQGLDIGFHRRYQTADKLRMTFGGVITNVGGMTFTRSSGNKLPEDAPMEVSVGMSFQPVVLAGAARILYEVDLRDILLAGTDDSDFIKRTHAGLELGFLPIDSTSSFLAVRGGYNQGYPTFGLEINPFIFFRIITFQLAVYSEEMGPSSGEIPEKRTAMQLSFAF